MTQSMLQAYEYQWKTNIGKAFLCERVVLRGQDLHHQLGDKDWFYVYLYGITGRELSDSQVKMLAYFWVASSYADPSIWPNHVAALGGTARSTASLSSMAGLAIGEASIYGRRPEKRALDFFYRAQQAIEQGQNLKSVIEQELAQGRTIYGYGRPLAKLDERIPHTLIMAKKLGLDGGKHLQLAKDVSHYLKKSKGLAINISAINTAIVADIGLTPEEYQLFLTPCFITGIAPCYLDAKNQPEGAFFPLSCQRIVYQGTAKRSWSSQD